MSTEAEKAYRRKYMREWRQRHTTKEQEYYSTHGERQNADRRARVKSRRTALADLKSSQGCGECGESDARCLDFHHRNPEEKAFSIGQNVRGMRLERLLVEAEKCDVLCANCHRKYHN